MKASPSQDPETRAQAQAEWRVLKMIRPAGAVAVLVTVVVCGIVELAIGHYRAGLTIFVIIGFFAVLTVAGLIRQRRRKRADTRG